MGTMTPQKISRLANFAFLILRYCRSFAGSNNNLTSSLVPRRSERLGTRLLDQLLFTPHNLSDNTKILLPSALARGIESHVVARIALYVPIYRDVKSCGLSTVTPLTVNSLIKAPP